TISWHVPSPSVFTLPTQHSRCRYISRDNQIAPNSDYIFMKFNVVPSSTILPSRIRVILIPGNSTGECVAAKPKLSPSVFATHAATRWHKSLQCDLRCQC